MKGFHCCLLLILALVGSLENLNLVCSAADPTDGFTPAPLTEANFELQKPYNIPLNDEDGGRHMWVLDYTSGAWQFEGYGFLPNGTSGVTVAQKHGAAEDASTLILRIYDGNLRYYSGDLVATGLYDRWFRPNTIHDVDGDWVTLYVDGEQKYSTPRVEGQATSISNAEFMLLFVTLPITWNQDATSGATVARALGASHGSTTSTGRINDGNMRYNSGDLVATDLYDRWLRRNITHDMDEGRPCSLMMKKNTHPMIKGQVKYPVQYHY
ncbi:hypothetical protein POTOM_009715 [Populus tomentosa]|uniref:Uncharacterized protein n=1 Tax=Populus tomentosa TaxID=118781 RepID=A0A8X8ACB0_POPTO|nr:hypothetical protein POTOM_009715 [Populus tomentosa]